MNPNHSPSCTCPEHPLPAGLSVRDALAAYLAENGFTTSAYDEPTTKGSLFGVKLSVPNPPSHRRAIRWHDLHHVATGFGTDHAGEGELSAWQARRGLWGTGAYVTGIVLVNTLLGFVFAPRRTARALASAGDGTSLFHGAHDYERLLAGTVGELRAVLGLPLAGLATEPRAFHAHAPSPSRA